MKIKDSEGLGYALYKKTNKYKKPSLLLIFRQGALAKSKFK